MHVIHTSKETSEALEAFIQPTLSDDKYTSIIELQEQLKKAHFVIAQLQHENRELKKKSLEEVFQERYLCDRRKVSTINSNWFQNKE
jgi:hypothetical protein